MYIYHIAGRATDDDTGTERRFSRIVTPLDPIISNTEYNELIGIIMKSLGFSKYDNYIITSLTFLHDTNTLAKTERIDK